jgi:hypothetical protein
MLVAPPGRAGASGRVHTWALSLATLLALGALTVFILVRSLNPPDASAPDVSRPAAAPDAIVGSVTLAGSLDNRLSAEAVLFVIARKTAGTPLAVVRIPQPRFPQPFRIGPENVMMAGTPLEGTVSLSARLSRSGSVGPAQSGDLEGEAPQPVPVGAGNATIVLNRAH